MLTVPLRLSELRGAQRCRRAPNQRLYQNQKRQHYGVLGGWSRYLSRVQAGGIASAGQMDGDTCDPTASERPIQAPGEHLHDSGLAAPGWKRRGQIDAGTTWTEE